MRDVYTEYVVPATANPLYKIAKVLLIVLVVLCILVTVLIGLIGLPPAILFGFLYFRIARKADGEYEYVHTNEELDIDLVIRNSKRKHLASVNLNQVILIAPMVCEAMEPYESLPCKDYSGTTDSQHQYGVVYTEGGSKKLLLMQMNAAMKQSLKSWIYDKVK